MEGLILVSGKPYAKVTSPYKVNFGTMDQKTFISWVVRNKMHNFSLHPAHIGINLKHFKEWSDGLFYKIGIENSNRNTSDNLVPTWERNFEINIDKPWADAMTLINAFQGVEMVVSCPGPGINDYKNMVMGSDLLKLTIARALPKVPQSHLTVCLDAKPVSHDPFKAPSCVGAHILDITCDPRTWDMPGHKHFAYCGCGLKQAKDRMLNTIPMMTVVATAAQMAIAMNAKRVVFVGVDVVSKDGVHKDQKVPCVDGKVRNARLDYFHAAAFVDHLAGAHPDIDWCYLTKYGMKFNNMRHVKTIKNCGGQNYYSIIDRTWKENLENA